MGCKGKHWVTVRYAFAVLNLTKLEIDALPSILVEAPNGIYWSAVKVSCETYHQERTNES